MCWLCCEERFLRKIAKVIEGRSPFGLLKFAAKVAFLGPSLDTFGLDGVGQENGNDKSILKSREEIPPCFCADCYVRRHLAPVRVGLLQRTYEFGHVRRRLHELFKRWWLVRY